jgi:hypothetical protein
VATDLTGDDVNPVVAPAAPAAPPEKKKRARYQQRFIIVYGILGVALAAAIAGIAVYAGHSISPGPTWSSWKPTGGGENAEKQIAAHVSATYRLPNGKQLVDVIAKAPSVSPAANQSIPIHYIALRGTKGAGDQILPITSSNSVMYSLCGLGASCSIASGKPSVERGTLVRRQILELALYTFKYVGGVDHVIAFMPPQPGAQPQYVVYLQKQDVADELSRPLSETLAKKVPLPKTIPSSEVRIVDAVTEPRVYTFSLSQAQTGDAVLVLAPLPA